MMAVRRELHPHQINDQWSHEMANKRSRVMGNVTLQARVSMEHAAWIRNVIYAMQHDEQGQPTRRVMTVGEIVEMALVEFKKGMTGLALSNITTEKLKMIEQLKAQGLYHGQDDVSTEHTN